MHGGRLSTVCGLFYFILTAALRGRYQPHVILVDVATGASKG